MRDLLRTQPQESIFSLNHVISVKINIKQFTCIMHFILDIQTIFGTGLCTEICEKQG